MFWVAAVRSRRQHGARAACDAHVAKTKRGKERDRSLGQNEAVESTGLYVMDLIQKLGENHSVTLGKLGDVLQGKINAPQPGALWFTLGPHTSLGDFIFELQALGKVRV